MMSSQKEKKSIMSMWYFNNYIWDLWEQTLAYEKQL